MQPTYGERLVCTLLEKLPNRKHFFWRAEPRLNHQRTARLQPDFIVVGTYLGVLVLEVKDWVAILEATQDQVIVRQRDGKQVTQDNPVRIAQDYAHALMDMLKMRAELLHQSGKYQGRLIFPVGYAVIFPNLQQAVIQQAVEANIWREGEVIGREALSSPEAFEEALTNVRMPFSLQGAISFSALDVIRGVIDPHLVIQDRTGQDIGTLSIPQEEIVAEEPKSFQAQQLALSAEGLPVELTDVLEETPQPELEVRMIRGVAGSGKTLTLVQRARRLIEQYPEKRILVVAFNKNLADDLRQQINHSAVDVRHFHKLCHDIIRPHYYEYCSKEGIADWLQQYEAEALRALRLSAEYVAEEIEYRKDMFLWNDDAYLRAERKGRRRQLNPEARQIVNDIFQSYRAFQEAENFWDWADAPHQALAALRNSHPLRHAFDAVLIDEAQDFAPSWIAVIKAVIKPRGYLFMCEDPSQSIFRYHSWQERGISIVGRTRLLRVPFRSTRAIAEVAHRLLADDPLIQEQDRIEPDLRTYALNKGTLPELVQCETMQEEAAYVHQVVQQLFAQDMQADQIAILLPYKNQSSLHATMKALNVRTISFYTMKGLEFRAVIVPHVQTLFEDTDEAELSKSRRLLFTAMTRAREQLYLSFSGDLPEPLRALNLTPKRFTPADGAKNAE
ncbi:MAG: UvrD-helicase domain-containing protein [Anaerolineae bacterium]|nr:UvrD-helicase domain-containing protein [Anaerolineae bacterium]MDW8299273.1 UvrD-helicase domain-containing protein [Anaerolineae bacterium]